MEGAEPQCFEKWHINPKTKRQNDNTAYLYDGDRGKYDLEKFNQAAHSGMIERFLQEYSVSMPDLLFHHDRQKGHGAHVAYPPYLDKQQYDTLPERGEIHRSVFDDKPCYANSRGGGKERINKSQFPIVSNREHKEKSSYKNENQKTQ